MGVNAQEYGYFFNSNNSDRTYNAESFESWIKPLMSNGVFGTGMQVSAQSTPNMSVSVAAGYANINGKIGAWPTANTMTIATASGVYPRWDVIVLRRDNTNRKITLEVKTGTASLTPSAPAPTRDADIYELVLAQIYVTAGTTSITNANIVDKRTDTSLCGLVTCPIVNPDFTPLYQQFTAQFEDWFDHMKDQLDDDAAGHLQLEIDDIKADIGIVEDTDTATHTIAAGQYVIWKGSLYKATTAIPASTALSLSNLAAVSNGLGGEVASLNGKITNLFTKTYTIAFDAYSGGTIGTRAAQKSVSLASDISQYGDIVAVFISNIQNSSAANYQAFMSGSSLYVNAYRAVSEGTSNYSVTVSVTFAKTGLS